MEYLDTITPAYSDLEIAVIITVLTAIPVFFTWLAYRTGLTEHHAERLFGAQDDEDQHER